MKKNLTHRQQEFLKQFLDIYQSLDQPIHYVTVAENLGIGNVTAYEMLRLLEDRGLVRSEYQTKIEQHGPGRSAVLFFPTKEANKQLTNLLRENPDIGDWQEVKERILRQLRDGKEGADYDSLLVNLIARLPENRSPIIFMTEMITAVVLMLREVKDSPEIHSILNGLVRVGLPEEVGLGVLSGIALLLSVLERTNRNCTSTLLKQISRYEDSLAHLNEENRQLLAEFTREASQIMTS